MKIAPCFAPAFALALSLPVHADPLDERLEKIRQTLSSAAAKAAAEPPAEPERARRQAMIIEMLRRYAEGLEVEPGENIAGALRQLIAMEGLPADAVAELKTLLSDLPKLTAERDESAIAAVEALVKKVAPACLAAKDEADLDPLLREISRPLRGQFSRSEDPRLARSQRKLQAAQHTVSQWQDYLAHSAAGNTKTAGDILQAIGKQTDYPVISAAQLAARLAAQPGASDVPDDAEVLRVLRAAKTLDELTVLVGELQVRFAGRPAATSSYFAALKGIASAYVSMRHGFFGEAFRIAKDEGLRFQGPANAHDWVPEIARLRSLLMLAILPRYLELPAGATPAAGEDAGTYLLRLATEGAAGERWAQTAQALDAYGLFAFRGRGDEPPWLEEDLVGLKAFAAAERFAAVQAFAEAIGSYRRAASVTGRFTPTAIAAKRLAELSAAHPDEAKSALRAEDVERRIEQLRRQFQTELQRSVESRLPADIRNRLTPPSPGH